MLLIQLHKNNSSSRLQCPYSLIAQDSELKPNEIRNSEFRYVCTYIPIILCFEFSKSETPDWRVLACHNSSKNICHILVFIIYVKEFYFHSLISEEQYKF